MKNKNNILTKSCLVIKTDNNLDDIYEIVVLIKSLQKQGTKYFILMPMLVIDNDVYQQQRIIQQQFLKLKAILPESKDQLLLGFRIIGSERLVQINQYNQFTIGHSKIVMVEANEYDNLLWINDLMYELKLQKIRLMLAQAECYEYFMKKPEALKKLVQYGLITDINVESILGKEGRQIKIWTKNMIKEKWVSCLSIHAGVSNKDNTNFNQAMIKINKWCNKTNKQQILYRNAQELFININNK